MKILNKYVVKEHAGPLAFALTTLTSLLLLNYIAKQFGNLVGKGLPWSVIGEFFLLSIPFTIAMTLPMAVLVSVLYAFSRLASENEITALRASGVSLRRLLVPVLVGAAGLAGVMVGFNDQILPRANHRLRVLQGDIARKKPTFALREQVINEVAPGRFYLRAGRVEESSNRMREITIYDLSDPLRRRTIYADSGDMTLSSTGGDLQLTLWDGVMQEVQKATPDQLQRLYYSTDFIRVRGVGNSFEKSTKDDFKSDREMSVCEMQRVYAEARRTQESAHRDLEATLALGVRRAATGAAITIPASHRDSAGWGGGVGGLYCAAFTPIVGALTRDSAKTAIDSVAEDSGDSAVTVAAGAAPSSGTVPPSSGMPVAGALPGQGGVNVAAPAFTIDPGAEGPVVAAQLNAAVETAAMRLGDAQRSMDAYAVEIQKKFALAVACIVFVLLGAPIALRFPRGGVGLTMGVSLGVFALYYMGLTAGETLANRGTVGPFLAMWATNILFTLFGFVLLSRMGKEGSTARGGDMGEFKDAIGVWFAKQGRRVGIHFDRRSHR